MDKQPDALQLAANLSCDDCAPKWLAHASATELRRQHALIAELVEALEAIDATARDDSNCLPDSATWLAIEAGRAIASKAKEQ